MSGTTTAESPQSAPSSDRGLDAFISYSRRDQEFVLRLEQGLERRGRVIWIDADSIPPGAPWRRELGTGIEAADAFVFVISPDSIASRECAEELERAVELGKRLIPVLYRATPTLPEALASVQYIDVGSDGDLEPALDRLDRAIAVDHEWAREHTEWLARALRWTNGGHDRSRLLRGRELEAAERWLARAVENKQPSATTLQTEYIVAGRHAERRRLRTIVALSLTALAVSIGLGVAAWLARNEAVEQRDQARSRGLAATAVNQLDTDPERSLLLALEAEEAAPSPAAHDALRRALVESHVRAVMRGHRGSVSRLALSPTGDRVVTTSRDGTARVFRTEDGAPVAVLRGHGRPIGTPSFSPDGDRVLTPGEDGTARLWDAATGRGLAVLRHDRGAVESASFDRTGRQVVTAGADATVRVWAVPSGRPVAVLRDHDAEVRSAVFDPTGRRVLTAGRDGVARVWRVGAPRSRVLVGGAGLLFYAQYTRDGRRVVTANDTGEARVSDARTGALVSTLTGAIVFDVALSRDGSTIATTTGDGPAAVWQTETGTSTATLEGHGGPVLDAAFSPDGSLVVTAGLDQTARVWDVRSGDAVAVLRGHAGSVNAAAFTPDGRSVITVSGDGTARRWDVGVGTVLRGHEGEFPSVNAAELSPDGTTVVTAANDLTARLWDARTGKEILHHRPCGLPPSSAFSCLSRASFGAHTSVIEDASFSPDGRRVVTSGDAGTIAVHDAVGGRRIALMIGHERRVFAVSFDARGRRVLSAGEDGTARVWEAETGRELAVARGHTASITDAAFFADGSRFATMSEDGTIRIWDACTGRQRRRIDVGPDLGIRIAVSPDGRYLAAPVDNVVRIVDPDSGRTVTTLEGHEGLVFGVGFAPDSRTVVTGGQDLTARLWEVPSGRALGVLRGHAAYLIRASFGPDGRTVVTAADDGTARVFTCEACGTVDALVRRGRERVTRQLSAEERRRFVA